MSQLTFIKDESASAPSKYSKKIAAPIYEAKGHKPHVLTLADDYKTKQLIAEIKAANIREDEKDFLIKAASRHTIFHYERIAEFYAHSTREVQELMERSALVIIDFNAAIENGFVQLCDEIRQQYLEEYADE